MASMSRKLEAYRVPTEDGEENEKQEAVALAGCDVHSSQLPSSADASPEMRRPNKVCYAGWRFTAPGTASMWCYTAGRQRGRKHSQREIL